MARLFNILTILTLILALQSCDFNYIDYIQHVESPDKKYNYCLYTDGIGIGDPGFMVLKLDKEIDPKAVKIGWNPKNGISQKDADWVYSKQILDNYEESSSYASDPKIEIVDKKFLVFSRGGFYFGLYDLQLEKDTFNNCCPWSEWASQNIWANKGTDYEGVAPKDEKSDYGIWVKKNIDNKIRDYIQTNK